MLDIETLEHKSRRPDVLVDDELIYAFYDAIIPEEISNGAEFDKWRRDAERDHKELLYLKREDLMRHEAAGVTTEAFPHQIRLGGVDFALSYHFEPGTPRDGVTLTVPLAQLNQIPAARCEWLVPGLLKEKVIGLVKTLPQKIRSKLVPVPDFAAEFVTAVEPCDKPLIGALIAYILRSRGLNARGWEITPDAFRPDALPAHLSFSFKLVDENERQLGLSRSLTELRGEWGGQAKQEFSELHETPSEYSGMTDWTFGELPELMEVDVGGGQMVVGYPGLADDGESVSLCVFDTAEEARESHARGLLRLCMLQFREQLKYFEKNLPGLTQMAMAFMPLGSRDDLRRQLIDLTFARACLVEPWPTDAASFKLRCAEAKSRLGLLAQEICRLVGQILADWQALQKKLPAFKVHGAALQDVEKQLARLVGKRFIEQTPFERLQHYPRYLKAVALRFDKLKAGGSEGAARDARLLAEWTPLWTNYERRAIVLAKQGVADAQVEQFRWFARRAARPALRPGTAHPGAGLDQAAAEDVGRDLTSLNTEPTEARRSQRMKRSGFSLFVFQRFFSVFSVLKALGFFLKESRGRRNAGAAAQPHDASSWAGVVLYAGAGDRRGDRHGQPVGLAARTFGRRFRRTAAAELDRCLGRFLAGQAARGARWLVADPFRRATSSPCCSRRSSFCRCCSIIYRQLIIPISRVRAATA